MVCVGVLQGLRNLSGRRRGAGGARHVRNGSRTAVDPVDDCASQSLDDQVPELLRRPEPWRGRDHGLCQALGQERTGRVAPVGRIAERGLRGRRRSAVAARLDPDAEDLAPGRLSASRRTPAPIAAAGIQRGRGDGRTTGRPTAGRAAVRHRQVAGHQTARNHRVARLHVSLRRPARRRRAVRDLAARARIAVYPTGGFA